MPLSLWLKVGYGVSPATQAWFKTNKARKKDEELQIDDHYRVVGSGSIEMSEGDWDKEHKSRAS